MAEMGKYCKAYYARDFRAFDEWQENLDNLRPETRDEQGKEIEVPRTELLDDDILYLQENYAVTDGVFKDEHVIFDEVTDEWKAACSQLPGGFEIPVYEPIEIRAEEEEGADAEAGASPAASESDS